MDVASYADDVRNSRPYTKNWHFVDIPIDEDTYVPSRDCKASPKGDCSIQAILRFGYILRNESEDDAVRAEALKFIIHLVGDMHQPLHNIDDSDAGGNSKIVRFYDLQGYKGGPPNLHTVWDDGVLQRYNKTVPELIKELGKTDLSDNDKKALGMVKPILWVLEAHKLGQDAYNKLPHPNADDVYLLDTNSDYYDAALPVVKQQLRLAGLRLGKALETMLG